MFRVPHHLHLAAAMLLGMAQPSPARADGSFLREPDYRVATIGYRIATASPALCPAQAPVSGLIFHHLADYEAADRPAMAAQGLDRGPGILAVVAGSQADLAGLRAGDVLLAVNGLPFASATAIAAVRDRRKGRAQTDAIETQFQDQLARAPATSLAVLRGSETLSLTLAPRTGCLFRIRLAYSDQQRAVAAYPYVLLTSAILDLVRNDDELAFLIAHEMAHIALNHSARLREAGVPKPGAMARGFGKNGTLVRQTEDEADQLGGRLMMAAGFDLPRGVMVLPRLGTTVTFFGLFQTHADDADRIRRMRELAGAPPA
ncbi:M48 family metalloprotease [Sphingomonas sp. AOB5]|uniref:M48 family metalloprotease n=1 Tax=Sphingomonas sp. AOB5 TaxID=3034017 RepID=UPI0023F9E2A0|nr:M48 family metalloprotease [Sphingomonas sp. AOB5]MDF7775426.1 M48 family metalloprotease [Sphingomonas sp. AOB5]